MSYALLVLATLAPVSWAQSPAASTTSVQDEARPNVLFIAVDDLRPSIGSYGDTAAITPNLDALAGRSVQFDRAYCQVAVCNPSRASLMTGQRPDKLGVWTLPVHFREAQPDAVTLPQWFRRFGYVAVSHGKIYHNPTPDPQSWSEPIRKGPKLPYPYPEGTRDAVKAAMKALPDGDWRKRNLRGPSTASPEFEDHELIDGARTDMAIEDLRRLGKGSEPFFLAMGFIRPHLAFVAPKPYWDLYDPADLPDASDARVTPGTPKYALPNNSELTHYVDLAEFPKPWSESPAPPESARNLIHGYYACVSYVDAQIGKLLNALEEEGLAENTIIVLWSDHGWKLGEHRAWGKMSNYEIDTRVPMMISTPGMTAAGAKCQQLVELLDLFPTLCDLVGIDTPAFADGKSLAPLLVDVDQSVREAAVSQYYRKLNGKQYMGYSLRTDSYRFIEWRAFATGQVTALELYDHRESSDETVNVVEDAPEALLDSLRAMLLEEHPRQPLDLIPMHHSSAESGRAKAEIEFKNSAGSTALICRLTSIGKRSRVRRVAPGATLTLSGQIGDVYVVESDDGLRYEVHSLDEPLSVVTLD